MKKNSKVVSSLEEDTNELSSFDTGLPPIDSAWIEAQSIRAESSIAGVTGESEEALIGILKECVIGELAAVADAHRASVSALIQGWTSGKILLPHKASIGHGEFTPWLVGIAKSVGTGVRTLQRHMKLAREHETVQDLVFRNSSLRQAYLTGSLLAEDSEPIAGADADQKGGISNTVAPSDPQMVVSLFTGFQKKLRTLLDCGPLDEVQSAEIKGSWEAINELYRKLIPA